MNLTGKQKRHLRGLGHALSPVVMVGHEGLTEAVLAKTRTELEHHELVKVKVLGSGEVGARDLGPALAEASGSALVQVLGGTVLLYRRRPGALSELSREVLRLGRPATGG